MSVVATNAFSTATGNGATTSFPYTFPARNAADVAVYVNGTLQVAGFTVTPNVGSNGGTVLFTTPPAGGAAILFGLAPSFQQSTTFINAGAYNPSAVDGANDQAAIRDIYLKGLIDRAPLVPLGETMGPLPAAASRIGKFFGFDAGGNPTPLSGTGNDSALRTDLVASTGATLVGFLASGFGAITRSLQSKLRESFGVFDYGANGAGGTDDAAVILKLVNAANGNIARLPVGQYRADASITIPVLSHIKGAGCGEGPGTLAGANCTQIIANFSDGHIWDFAPSVFGSTVEGIQFNSYSQRNSGAAIHLKGTGSVTGTGPYTVSGSVVSGGSIRRCGFNSQAVDILLDVAGWNEVHRTYHQSWKTNAIETTGDGLGLAYLGVSVGNESEGGWISKNMFFGDTAAGTTQNAAFRPRCGYFKSTQNHYLGAKYGVDLLVDQYPAGAPEIRDDLFEEQDVAAVHLKNGSGQKASSVKIHDSEFSVASLGAAGRPNFLAHILAEAGTASWIEELSICLNVARTAAAVSTAALFDVQTGDSVTISLNTLEGLTGNTTKGIRVGAQVGSAQVLDNVIKGAFGARYVLTTACFLRDFGSGLTAAEVNAITCANGSIVWVADGNPALPTLTGSSTGCIAIMRGGVWSPLMTLHGSVAGYGTPIGGARLSNFPGATATLAQTSGALAQLLLDLEALGVLKS